MGVLSWFSSVGLVGGWTFTGDTVSNSTCRQRWSIGLNFGKGLYGGMTLAPLMVWSGSVCLIVPLPAVPSPGAVLPEASFDSIITVVSAPMYIWLCTAPFHLIVLVVIVELDILVGIWAS